MAWCLFGTRTSATILMTKPNLGIWDMSNEMKEPATVVAVAAACKWWWQSHYRCWLHRVIACESLIKVQHFISTSHIFSTQMMTSWYGHTFLINGPMWGRLAVMPQSHCGEFCLQSNMNWHSLHIAQHCISWNYFILVHQERQTNEQQDRQTVGQKVGRTVTWNDENNHWRWWQPRVKCLVNYWNSSLEPILISRI